MFEKVLRALFGLSGFYLFSRLWIIMKWLPTYWRYKRAGVVFPNGWNYFADAKMLDDVQKSNLHGLDLDKALKDKLKTKDLPPVIGLCIRGVSQLFVTKAEPLDQIYKAKNQLFSKSRISTDAYHHIMKGSMLMDKTSDPLYL